MTIKKLVPTVQEKRIAQQQRRNQKDIKEAVKTYQPIRDKLGFTK
jgi:hypothetical protein